VEFLIIVMQPLQGKMIKENKFDYRLPKK